MNESKKEWKSTYAKVVANQELDFGVKTPENFINDIKLSHIRSYIPDSGIVVEIGAGSGRFMIEMGLNNKKLSFVGVDFVSSKLVKDNFLKYDINGISVCGDAFNIPIKTGSVDVVMSGGLLEHFNEVELDKILKEMMRILKPGGLFYAEIVPKKFSLCRPIILTNVGGYENSFSKKEWYKMLKNNKYMNINVFSAIVIPPDFYRQFRSGIKLEFIYKIKNIIKKLDNTIISDIFGFVYIIFATKEKDSSFNRGI